MKNAATRRPDGGPAMTHKDKGGPAQDQPIGSKPCRPGAAFGAGTARRGRQSAKPEMGKLKRNGPRSVGPVRSAPGAGLHCRRPHVQRTPGVRGLGSAPVAPSGCVSQTTSAGRGPRGGQAGRQAVRQKLDASLFSHATAGNLRWAASGVKPGRALPQGVVTHRQIPDSVLGFPYARTFAHRTQMRFPRRQAR
jgi:hypothetical protein